MRLRLYVVHGSHPCAAVEKALQLKGLDYRVREWPPAAHFVMQRLIFGARTVPGLTIDGREKVHGSRAIMRRLEELAPEPALFPADPELRAKVQAAERWGDEVFQPIARELVWAGMLVRPKSMVSYGEHSRIPLPAAGVRLMAPGIARIEARANRTSAEIARRDLEALPGQLDKIDGWIAEGVIGDAESPNAADLQIATTLRLMMTVGDARSLIEGRSCAELAIALFPQQDGEIPAGALVAA